MDTHLTLGIPGLPASAAVLNSGALYIAASASKGLTQSLLFGNLPSGNALPLIIVSTNAPHPQQDTSWLDRRIHAGNILLLSPQRPGNMRVNQLETYLNELLQCRKQVLPAQGGVLLVLDDAETLLDLENPAAARRALQVLSAWAAAHGHCVLLLVDSISATPTAIAALEQLGGDCAGLAFASYAGQDCFSWQVSHWLGATAHTSSAIYTLEQDAGLALRLPSSQEEQEEAEPRRIAHDQQRILATTVSLSGNAAPSAHWQVFPDLASLMNAAQDAVSATVLMDTASEKREVLISSVDQLRRQCGKHLKIIVREVGNRRLRQNEEQLLLRLGANAVLPAELRFASVLHMVAALQPAVFQNRKAIETDKLHEASQPELDRGYLAPQRFIEVVRKTVARSRAIDINNMLIQLRPAVGASTQDLLALGQFKRAGDLCTADNEFVYLFLFACRESDVDAALRNLFRLPIGEVADYDVRSPDADTIEMQLSRMEKQPGYAELQDMSHALNQPLEHEPLARPAKAVKQLPTPQRSPLRRKDATPETPSNV